jgi:hypothetical protein
MMGQDMVEQAVQIGDEFYNVAEQYTWYDTIAITGQLSSLSKQPPGWYATFAAFSAATLHSFFNVRNDSTCDDAYCNLDARDQTPFAFQAREISLAFWGTSFNQQTYSTLTRYWQPGVLWQAALPFHSSLTLRIQQDDKTKLNSLMINPGYGPMGGGYGQQGASTQYTGVYPGVLSQTQGVPAPAARIKFPNVINIPRRASIAAELNFTQYARALLAALPGPGSWTYYQDTEGWSPVTYPVMFGVTCGLHGRRLVQQRGALHA